MGSPVDQLVICSVYKRTICLSKPPFQLVVVHAGLQSSSLRSSEGLEWTLFNSSLIHHPHPIPAFDLFGTCSNSNPFQKSEGEVVMDVSYIRTHPPGMFLALISLHLPSLLWLKIVSFCRVKIHLDSKHRAPKTQQKPVCLLNCRVGLTLNHDQLSSTIIIETWPKVSFLSWNLFQHKNPLPPCRQKSQDWNLLGTLVAHEVWIGFEPHWSPQWGVQGFFRMDLIKLM